MKTYIGAQELFDDEFDMCYPEPYPVGKWLTWDDVIDSGYDIRQDFNCAELWKAGNEEDDPVLWVVSTDYGVYRKATDDEWMACNGWISKN